MKTNAAFPLSGEEGGGGGDWALARDLFFFLF